MIRSFFLGVLLALASTVVAVPTPVQAGERCNCPGCKCDECNKSCKCCGPKATEQAGQCPGPNCPNCPVVRPQLQPVVQPDPKQGPFRPQPRGPIPVTPAKTPVSPDGLRAVADLPVDQHHRNTGGIGRGGPGTGAGLCVFTSIWHAAIWQHLTGIYGFRDWMQDKQGGGWPEKVDQTLAQFCKEKGIEVPGYVQHTGGDVSFLKHALSTGRMCCVTYAGQDDFYSGPIGHMVNLIYLDDDAACILDNNRPGTFVWMPASFFITRWLDQSGGWAIVFTAPPPPPYAVKPGVQEFLATPPDETEGHKRMMNGGGPPVAVFEEPADATDVLTYDDAVQKAKETGLPLVTFVGLAPKAVHGCLVCTLEPGSHGVRADARYVMVSKWVGDRHVGVPATQKPFGQYDVDAAVAKIDPNAGKTEEAKQVQQNYGVDLSKIDRVKRYSIKGRAATKKEAFGAVEPTVDEAELRWNLSFVGSGNQLAKVKALVKQLPIMTQEKLNVHCYTPDDWAVRQFNLRAGVNLRKPDAPKIDRVADDVPVKGDLLDDLTLELLVKLIDQAMNPTPVAPQPHQPDPVTPVTPTPGPVTPTPPVTPNPPVDPKPSDPKPADSTNPLWLVLAALLAVWFFRNRQPAPVPPAVPAN